MEKKALLLIVAGRRFLVITGNKHPETKDAFRVNLMDFMVICSDYSVMVHSNI